MSYLAEHDRHTKEEGWTSFDVITISGFLGSIEVEICDRCGYKRVFCRHKYSEWTGEEPKSKLLCIMCGKDCT